VPTVRNPVVLLTTLSLGAALLGVPSTAHAETCPDPADQIIAGWSLNEEQILRDTDPFAFSPGATNVAFSHTGYCFPLTLTVERPDGSARHLTVIDTIADGTIGYHQFGWDWFDYATGTGPWRVTKAAWNGITVDLTTPVDFRTTRASVVTLAATPGALPTGPRVTGTVKYWTYQGVLAPSPGRTVWIRQPGWSYPFQPGAVIATITTDATGRFAVTLPIRTNQQVVADVPRTTTLGLTFTDPVQTTVYQPTSITGYAAPTTATVIRRGTRMSTYGHLSVVYTTGKTGPFANQRAVVQTRPRSNPSAPYTTVASDVTKPSGYYYANWYASIDVDVRVAFISPYQSIRSSYRWLRVVDVM
jgi:hypothetical protein